MKAKGPAAAKVEEDKKKGLVLFGPKPQTPKLLRALGGTINKKIINKMKVTTPCLVFDYDLHALTVPILSLNKGFCCVFLQTTAGNWKL